AGRGAAIVFLAGIAVVGIDRLVAGEVVVAERTRRVVGIGAVGEHDDDLVVAALRLGTALGEGSAARHDPPAPGKAALHAGGAVRLHGVDRVGDRLHAGGVGHVCQWRDRLGGATRVWPSVAGR